jgi:hypothetical protein
MYSRSMWFDLEPAMRDLDWSPTFSNDEMFVDSYEWFLANRSSLKTSGGSHHRTLAKQGVLGVAKAILRR